jgi:arylsulfatase A-like enzyme
MSNRPLVRISGFYGNHTMAGIFVAHGPRVKPGTSVADANILDVAPTVLHLAGLPVPDGMDGRVRTDILDDAFNREHPVRFVPDADHPQAGDARLSEEDEAEVMEKLRGLGYIG